MVSGLREDIACQIIAQRAHCPDHPPVMTGGDCWTCGRNGAFTRAARIALGQLGPPGPRPSFTDAHFDPGLIGEADGVLHLTGTLRRSGRDVEIDGDGLTLGDLRALVALMDVAGAAESTPVSVSGPQPGRLGRIRATAVRFGDHLRRLRRLSRLPATLSPAPHPVSVPAPG